MRLKDLWPFGKKDAIELKDMKSDPTSESSRSDESSLLAQETERWSLLSSSDDEDEEESPMEKEEEPWPFDPTHEREMTDLTADDKDAPKPSSVTTEEEQRWAKLSEKEEDEDRAEEEIVATSVERDDTGSSSSMSSVVSEGSEHIVEEAETQPLGESEKQSSIKTTTAPRTTNSNQTHYLSFLNPVRTWLSNTWSTVSNKISGNEVAKEVGHQPSATTRPARFTIRAKDESGGFEGSRVTEPEVATHTSSTSTSSQNKRTESKPPRSPSEEFEEAVPTERNPPPSIPASSTIETGKSPSTSNDRESEIEVRSLQEEPPIVLTSSTATASPSSTANTTGNESSSTEKKEKSSVWKLSALRNIFKTSNQNASHTKQPLQGRVHFTVVPNPLSKSSEESSSPLPQTTQTTSISSTASASGISSREPTSTTSTSSTARDSTKKENESSFSLRKWFASLSKSNSTPSTTTEKSVEKTDKKAERQARRSEKSKKRAQERQKRIELRQQKKEEKTRLLESVPRSESKSEASSNSWCSFAQELHSSESQPVQSRPPLVQPQDEPGELLRRRTVQIPFRTKPEESFSLHQYSNGAKTLEVGKGPMQSDKRQTKITEIVLRALEESRNVGEVILEGSKKTVKEALVALSDLRREGIEYQREIYIMVDGEKQHVNTVDQSWLPTPEDKKKIPIVDKEDFDRMLGRPAEASETFSPGLGI